MNEFPEINANPSDVQISRENEEEDEDEETVVYKQ